MAKIDSLAHLNPEQREAVLTIDRPLKIVAGAGTGKTNVITTKIAHLINEHNYFPSQILAVTFTNKAAREMKERVAKMVIKQTGAPWILTFHALGVRILRTNHDSIKLPASFNIIDQGDQKTIIRRIVKAMFPRQESTQADFEKKALRQISEWKNDQVNPKEALAFNQNIYLDNLAKIYEAYDRELQRNQSLDFDDLLLRALEILHSDSVALKKWQEKFKYILVDEFQDTNQVQFDLIKMLRGQAPQLTVVGDPDQTIYSWRGAKNEIINNFNREFKHAKTVVLKQNYRSTQEILNLANDFIALNPHQEIKKLTANQKSGVIPQIHETLTGHYEAKFIAQEIKRLKKQHHYQNSDFFVLYRSNYWSRNLENVFTNEKLPFDLIGGIKFRERKVVKDALAFMKVLLTNDDLSMERVLRVTPRIGEVTVNKLRLMAREQDLSLFDLLVAEEPLVLKVSKYLAPLRDTFIKAQTKKDQSLEKLTRFLLVNSGYWDYAKSIDNLEHDNIDNLNELLQQLQLFDQEFEADNYGTDNRLLAFLQEEALSGNEDNLQTPNKITLLTIHSAKGLENKVVFVAGLNHGVFPSIHSAMKTKSLEEERRLLYVAITRAQERLYLTYVNGEYSVVTKSEMRPSKFIGELNRKHFHWHGNAVATHHREIEHQLPSSLRASLANHKIHYQRNDLVNHFVLGDGVVTKVVGDEVFVAFNNPKFGVQAIAINSPVLRKK